MKIHSTVAVILMAFAFISCGSKKGSSRVSDNFTINILSVKDGTVKLECTEGCAWTDLSWSKNNNRSQTINAYGVTEDVQGEVNLKDDLPEFKFRIIPTDNGAILESLYGTEWKTLSFSCPTECNQLVNYKGLAK